jgi:hypothetical protein
MINPKNRAQIYECFLSVYKKTTGQQFKWKNGEKSRAMAIFIKIKEEFKLRAEEDFDIALDRYNKYLYQSSQKWLRWSEASRSNYLGFLSNKDNISIFTSSFDRPYTSNVSIAGTSDSNVWDF